MFTLAIAMACVGALLSLYIDLIRPHPGFEQGGRIATIGQSDGSSTFGDTFPYSIVERMSDEMTTVTAAAIVDTAAVLVGSSQEQTTTALVSREFFNGLLPRLALGRGFKVEDHAPDGEPVVVLSFRYWQERFDGSRNAIGTILEIERDPRMRFWGPDFRPQAAPEQEVTHFRIVGVMAESVPNLAHTEPAFWLPLERIYPQFIGVSANLLTETGETYVRMQEGTSALNVANEFRARFLGNDSQFSLVPGRSFDVIEGVVSNFPVHRDAKRQLMLLLGASLLLAVAAGANVSLFLLARAPGRRQELGVRMAVGAPVTRLARQLATEAGLLVVVSSLLGMSLSVLLALYLRGIPLFRAAEWRDVTILDWRVLSLSGAAILILAMLVSLAPIMGVNRQYIAASSRQVLTRAPLAQLLIGTGQIAVTGMLASAAIALSWHVASMMLGNSGFEIASRYTVEGAGAMPARDVNGAPRHIELARRREVIESIPGVNAVAFGYPVPGGQRSVTPDRLRNDYGDEIEVYSGSLNGRFVDLLGLSLVHGRAPDDGEQGVVVVNQALARLLWGRDDVVGEQLMIHDEQSEDVVGVIKDISFYHPSEAVQPFRFAFVDSYTRLDAIIETSLTQSELQQSLDRLVSNGDLEIPIPNLRVRSLKAMRNEWIAPDRARAVLTVGSAVLVFTLAAFGLYGTQRYLVATGRREYAIRAVLGASPSAVRRLVLRRGLLLSTPGVIAGSLLAFIIAAGLRDSVISREISAGLVTCWVAVGLILLVFGASIGPALDAQRTEAAPFLRQ